MSILGRSLVVLLVVLLGMIGGAVIGGYRGVLEAQALPPSPGTMGSESAGFVPFIVIGVHVAIGGAGGALGGLVLGVLGAILWPRRTGA